MKKAHKRPMRRLAKLSVKVKPAKPAKPEPSIVDVKNLVGQIKGMLTWMSKERTELQAMLERLAGLGRQALLRERGPEVRERLVARGIGLERLARGRDRLLVPAELVVGDAEIVERPEALRALGVRRRGTPLARLGVEVAVEPRLSVLRAPRHPRLGVAALKPSAMVHTGRRSSHSSTCSVALGIGAQPRQFPISLPAEDCP